MNSGDWVENLTALEFDGFDWRIYRYFEDERAQSIRLPKRLNLDNDLIFKDLVSQFLMVKR